MTEADLEFQDTSPQFRCGADCLLHGTSPFLYYHNSG